MGKHSQRLVALLAAIIILFEVAAVPQKTKAVAVSASVVAAVAAIMTACGVRYWAATNDYAMDYLSDKINSYLVLNTVPGENIPTYEEWLGIDATSQLWEVTANGVMSFTGSIASKILDFVRWSFDSDNVHSNGPTVGLLAGPVPVLTTWYLAEDDGTAEISYSGSSVHVRFSDVKCYDRRTIFTAAFHIPGVTAATITIDTVDTGNTESIPSNRKVVIKLSDDIASGGHIVSLREGNSYRYSSSAPCNYVCLSFNNPTPYTDAEDVRHFWGATFSLEIEGGPGGLSYPDRVKVEPSTDVFVPDNVRPNQTEPYVVATNAALAQGMTADQAADAIMDAVITTGLTAEDGDDAEPEGGVLEGWGWLSDTLDAIHDFVAGIAQTILGIPQAIGEAAQDIITGIQSIPGMISDALTDLFVPDEAFVETYVDSLVGLFEGRVGILTYPLALFVQFLNRFASIEDGDHTFRWGAIHEPFSGRQVIASGSYDLDDAVASSPMSSVYSIYLIAVKAIVAFWFLHLCQKKYDQIINRH